MLSIFIFIFQTQFFLRNKNLNCSLFFNLEERREGEGVKGSLETNCNNTSFDCLMKGTVKRYQGELYHNICLQFNGIMQNYVWLTFSSKLINKKIYKLNLPLKKCFIVNFLIGISNPTLSNFSLISCIDSSNISFH